MAGMVPFFTRLLERVDKLPALTQRGRGGLGASAECCRWYLFSLTPEPKLTLISRTVFGGNVDGREIGARFYGMSVDPQLIRTGVCGIRDDQKRAKKGAYDTSDETQPIRRRLSHIAQPGHRRGSAHVAPHYYRKVQTVIQTVETVVQTVVQTVEKPYPKSRDRRDCLGVVFRRTLSSRF